MSKYVVLSAGHGGTDPGAVGNGFQEHKLALELWNLVKDYIVENYTDVIVKVIEEKDNGGQFKSNTAYWGDHSEGGAYSGHFNSSTSSSAHGTEVLVGNYGTSRCKAINDALAKHFTNRGLKEVDTKDYYMLREVGFDMIMEVCFISSKSDIDYYQKNKKTIAKDVAEAIAKIEKLTKKNNGSNMYFKDEVKIAMDYKDNPNATYRTVVLTSNRPAHKGNKMNVMTLKKGQTLFGYKVTKNGKYCLKFRYKGDFYWTKLQK